MAVVANVEKLFYACERACAIGENKGEVREFIRPNRCRLNEKSYLCDNFKLKNERIL